MKKTINGDCEPYIEPMLAKAYVLWQQWEEPYSPDEALNCGTVFPSLFEAGKPSNYIVYRGDSI